MTIVNNLLYGLKSIENSPCFDCKEGWADIIKVRDNTSINTSCHLVCPILNRARKEVQGKYEEENSQNGI